MKKFIPKAVYYEEKARQYYLGQKLLEEYESKNIPTYIIENHNNIEQKYYQKNT